MAPHHFFYFLCESLERVFGNISPLASTPHTGYNLLAAKGFGQPIAFYNQQLGLFYSGESAIASAAFPTPPNGGTTVDNTRVDDFRLFILAEGTVHIALRRAYLGRLSDGVLTESSLIITEKTTVLFRFIPGMIRVDIGLI